MFKNKKYFFILSILLIIIGCITFLILLSNINKEKYNQLISFLSQQLFPITSSYIYIPCNDLSKISGIMKTNNVLIRHGSNDEWDSHIREIGNIIYSKKYGKYFFYYSGYSGAYHGNNVYIGVASSIDGAHWQKHGKAIIFPGEDPYVILKDKKFYMFFENKKDIPFKNIACAISSDGIHFNITSPAVLPAQRNDWNSRDVSSPVVFKYNNMWIMIYEGRGKVHGQNNWGMIGIATSKNLQKWTLKANPVFKKFRNWLSPFFYWDCFVVPDDILIQDKNIFLTYHGYGFPSKKGFQTSILFSSNLKKWQKVSKNIIIPYDTVMITRMRGKIYLVAVSEEGDVTFYLPLM